MEAQRQCPSQTPRRKSCMGLNPGTGVATALTRHLLFLCVLSTFVASFDWDTLARLCTEPESRLVERFNHYCLHSTVALASFLTCFTDLWLTLYSWIVFKFCLVTLCKYFIDCIFWTDHISLYKRDLAYLCIIFTNHYHMYLYCQDSFCTMPVVI